MAKHIAQLAWELSEVEALKAVEWMNIHECKRKKTQHFTFTFKPTALGVACKVTCSCKKYEDITDYSSW